jgi:hypothetical protein
MFRKYLDFYVILPMISPLSDNMLCGLVLYSRLELHSRRQKMWTQTKQIGPQNSPAISRHARKKDGICKSNKSFFFKIKNCTEIYDARSPVIKGAKQLGGALSAN